MIAAVINLQEFYLGFDCVEIASGRFISLIDVLGLCIFRLESQVEFVNLMLKPLVLYKGMDLCVVEDVLYLFGPYAMDFLNPLNPLNGLYFLRSDLNLQLFLRVSAILLFLFQSLLLLFLLLGPLLSFLLDCLYLIYE